LRHGKVEEWIETKVTDGVEWMETLADPTMADLQRRRRPPGLPAAPSSEPQLKVLLINLNTMFLFVMRRSQTHAQTVSDRREDKQEAQLLQRVRAMLHVIEFFTKSLKVSEGHSK